MKKKLRDWRSPVNCCLQAFVGSRILISTVSFILSPKLNATDTRWDAAQQHPYTPECRLHLSTFL